MITERTRIFLTLALGALGLAACAAAQPQDIPTSPASGQRIGATVAAQPVYSVRPQPAASMTLAPAPEYVEEEEEGYYWVWGQKWPGLALGPKFGTTGIGLDLTFGINPYLNLRGGFNYGSFTWSPEFGDVDYDMDITMTSIPLLLDIQPFGGNFRITGGFFIQPGTEADIDATPTDATQIGNHTYEPDVIGTLSGKVEVKNTVAPYVGIGFGNTVAEDQQLTCTLDIGVVFQSYDVSLTSDGAGMTAKLDTFREDLAKEEDNIQNDLDDWKIYPVVTIGLAWHF